MKKFRYAICILATIYLIIEAAPMLPTEGISSATIFTGVWILFACFVLSGNILALRNKINKKGKQHISIDKQLLQKRQVSR